MFSPEKAEPLKQDCDWRAGRIKGSQCYKAVVGADSEVTRMHR